MKKLLIFMLVLGLATTANAYIVSDIELDITGGMSAIAIKLPSGMSYSNDVSGGYWAIIGSSNAASPVETTTGAPSGGTLQDPAGSAYFLDLSAVYTNAGDTGLFSSGSGIWGEFTTASMSTTWTTSSGNYLTGVSATSTGVSLYLISDAFDAVTHIETVPEPATIALLGLGGLLLRRRKG